MDHLIEDHERRSRRWGAMNSMKDIELNTKGGGNMVKSYVLQKLLIISIGIVAGCLSRLSWLEKSKYLIRSIGIDKIIDKINKSKVVTFIKNIRRKKSIVVPEVVVVKRNTNFISKLLITLVLGSGLGIGIHQNQECLKREIEVLGDKLQSLNLGEKLQSLHVGEKLQSLHLGDMLQSVKLQEMLSSIQVPKNFDQSREFIGKLAKQTNSRVSNGLRVAKSNLDNGFNHANKGISFGLDRTIDTGKKISMKLQEVSSSSLSTLSDVSTTLSSSLSSSLYEVVNEGKQIISNIDVKSKQMFTKLTARKAQTNTTRLVKTMMFAELTKDGDSSIRATFVNGNGNTLACRLWEEKKTGQNMRPFVVFLHGIGAHVNRVPKNESGIVLGDEYVAQYFLRKGFNFYSFDMEGHGFSQGERIFIQDWKNFMADAEQFLELVKRRSPKGTPYFLMGESFGGALSVVLGQKLWGINDQNINVFKDFKGVLLIAPAISVEMPSPVVVFILRYLLAPIMPKVSPFFMPQPLSKEKIWEDKSVADWCIEEDTLGNGREKLKLGTAMQVVLLMEYVQKLIKSGKVSFPWAVVQADGDSITPIEGTNLLLNYSVPYIEVTKNKVKQNANKILTIRAGYHDLLTSRQSDQILNFLTNWANERLVTFNEKLNK